MTRSKAEELVVRNGALYRQGVSLGARVYRISSLTLTREDWKQLGGGPLRSGRGQLRREAPGPAPRRARAGERAGRQAGWRGGGVAGGPGCTESFVAAA